ncbi:MAG: RNA polymerase sigma-70 factor [Tannerellaceae bacterium]|jgi:RNA polymerase sigma-70 factor (ECF subfamily)|nr:RNA polymerase sigma-70 factor [Tannerellaceae bacterium]
MEDKQDILILNRLITDYQGRFIRFANTYIRDEAVANDFVIEAFMKYWEKRHTLRVDSDIPSYILTIIKHKCLNYLEHIEIRQDIAERMRKHAHWEMQTRITSLRACEPEELFAGEVQAIVDRTLAALPKQTQQIFFMSRYENKPHKEIAFHFNISSKGVEFHVSKALKALRKNLKDYLPFFF